MNGAREILQLMLKDAARVRPWKADELSQKLVQQRSSTYRYLRQLKNNKLIQHYNSGYVLSTLILESGSRHQLALTKIAARGNTEELYD